MPKTFVAFVVRGVWKTLVHGRGSDREYVNKKMNLVAPLIWESGQLKLIGSCFKFNFYDHCHKCFTLSYSEVLAACASFGKHLWYKLNPSL